MGETIIFTMNRVRLCITLVVWAVFSHGAGAWSAIAAEIPFQPSGYLDIFNRGDTAQHIIALEQRINSLNAEIEKNETSLKELERESEPLTAGLKELTLKIETAKAKKDGLKREIEVLNKSLADLDTNRSDVENLINNPTAKLSESNRQNLSNKLGDMLSEKLKIMNKITRRAIDLNNINTELGVNNAELSANIESLVSANRSIHLKTAILENLKAERHSAMESVAALKELGLSAADDKKLEAEAVEKARRAAAQADAEKKEAKRVAKQKQIYYLYEKQILLNRAVRTSKDTDKIIWDPRAIFAK